MALTPEKIKEWVANLPEKGFEACRDAVYERAEQQGDTKEFDERIKDAVMSLPMVDLRRGIQNAIVKGDSSMISRLTVIMEAMRDKASRPSAINFQFVPYTIPDPSLNKIIAKCDPERFREIEAVVGERHMREGTLYEYISYLTRLLEVPVSEDLARPMSPVRVN